MDHESVWDQRLQINTTGLDETNADPYHFRYEPTPYRVLERLADSGLIGKQDVLLDYGCGKGRVGFFLTRQTGACTIGIEYDPNVYHQALRNQSTFDTKTDVMFVLTRAEEYTVPANVNRCYFFNPFSVELLQSVLAQILASYYESPREILLFFYYPSEEYVSYLMSTDALEFRSEIPCSDLFDHADSRERIMIFALPDYKWE